MIRIVIDLPTGPNTPNEIAKIASAALTSGAKLTIENTHYIPPPVTGEHTAITTAIPADSSTPPRIEDFAHTVENGDTGGNGRRTPKG